jgi:hypothetical protein
MNTQIRPAIRIFLTLIGVLLVVAAFAGVLLLGTMTSRPTLRVAVAVRDLNIGERLGMSDFRIVDQMIDPSLGRLYVQAPEIDAYLDKVIVDVIRRGDPLNKIKLAAGDDASAMRRYTLVLTNADDVLMTLPVNPDLIPPKLAAGDYVNILFTAGDEAGINRLPTDLQGVGVSGGLVSSPTPLPALPAPADPNLPTSTPIPTPTPAVALPLADLMLQRVPVVDVTYQKLQNPRYGAMDSAGNDQLFIDGPITSIVVKVPRQYQTLLGFGIATSKLRFAIASPVNSAVRPEMGVDWNTYLQFYRWKQEQVAMRGDTVNSIAFPNYQPVTATVTAQPVSVTP